MGTAQVGWGEIPLGEVRLVVDRWWFPDLDEADDLIRLHSGAVTSTVVAPDGPPAPIA